MLEVESDHKKSLWFQSWIWGQVVFPNTSGFLHTKADSEHPFSGPKLCWCIPLWLWLIFLMETSANMQSTIGLLQFLQQQCSYATFSAPIWLSEVYSAASASVKKDINTYRVTIKHCSPPHSWQQRAGGEGQWEHQHCSTPFLSPTIDTVPETCSFCPGADTTWGQTNIQAPSHYSLSLKSTELSGWFLACPTLFEELKPCSGIEPIVSTDRRGLGSSRTYTQLSHFLRFNFSRGWEKWPNLYTTTGLQRKVFFKQSHQ